MEPEEARWVRPTPPPDEELQRPFGGQRPSILVRTALAILGTILAGIVFCVVLTLILRGILLPASATPPGFLGMEW
jgi:hypothetical protein